MKYAIQIVITTDKGQTETRDIACVEREDLTPTTLGLTLAEGKAILKGLQAVVMQQQLTAYLKTQRPCAQCGHVQRSKGSHTTQIRTVLGLFAQRPKKVHFTGCMVFNHLIDIRLREYMMRHTGCLPSQPTARLRRLMVESKVGVQTL